jgi:LuxR family transcriptional activator of conjugal transfer of Ti plasmids
MHRIFQNFIDCLAAASNAESLRGAMAEAAAALDLSCFAYLSMPHRPGARPQLLSSYPSTWTAHYLQNHYERLDPVVIQALSAPVPFEWGLGVGPAAALSQPQRQLFEEAAKFGVRFGYTVPIHGNRGPAAAVTFAADERRSHFTRRIDEHARVLQLMAMYFHAHACRKLVPDCVVDGIALSPRELECVEWAAQGKSAWEIGHILGISRRTAAFHLDNAKKKLGVHSICQAVARLIASRTTI